MVGKIFSKFKILLKLLFISLGYRINKISKREKSIQMVNIMEDNFDRLKLLQKLVVKYPDDSLLQLKLFESCLETNHPDFNKNLELYHNKNQKFCEKNLVKNLDVEFIPLLIFIGALGNTLQLRTLIEANELNLRTKKKLYLFWPKQLKPRNKVLFDYFKKYINLIENEEEFKNLYNSSERLEVPLRVCVNFKKFSLTTSHSSNFVSTFKKENNIEDKAFLNLKNEHKLYGEKQLEKIKLPKNSWYVTLHVREPEPGYRGETLNNTTEEFRNANPENYLKAIHTIISRGGYVFRMGHPGITPMPKIPGLIDYANSEMKSELMDVFLGATCKFCIGTSSGYHAIPSFFSVPRLLTDVPGHNAYFLLKEHDLYLPRLFMKINEGKKMKFKEMFSYPFNALGHDDSYKRFNIKPLHNTPDEINEATKEMISKTIDKKHFDDKNNNQEKFKEIIKNTSFQQTKVKLSSFADISPSFLEKNINLL